MYNNFAYTFGFRDEIVHLWDFPSPQMLSDKDSFVSCGESCLTISGARKKFSKSCIQMTITDSQLNSYDHSKEIIKHLIENNFEQVFSHVNPNTNRIVYTLMAPPLEANIPERRARNSSRFYEKMWEGMSPGTIYHAGGCCGVSQIVGLNPRLPSDQVRDHIKNIFGTMFSRDKSGKGFFFILNRDDLPNYCGLFNTLISYSAFKPVFNWYSRHTGNYMSMYMGSFNKVDSKIL